MSLLPRTGLRDRLARLLARSMLPFLHLSGRKQHSHRAAPQRPDPAPRVEVPSLDHPQQRPQRRTHAPRWSGHLCNTARYLTRARRRILVTSLGVLPGLREEWLFACDSVWVAGVMATRRALHFVFKVGNRFQTVHFFRDVLGMQVLRHEEFEEGCKAACNGPYDGKWSKTMMGFGPEDDHFVAELTYNYGIGDYKLGNDFMGITLASSQAVSNARKLEWPLKKVAEGVFETEAPGGYKFYLQDRSLPQSDPVLKVTLAVTDIHKSLNYWSSLLGMNIYEQDEEKQRALLGYADNQCKLELQGIKGAVDHAAAFGRIAFSCPQKELPDLEDLMKKENQLILTPLVSLDTPGKATVQVVILADPDGHEICFVGDEAFRELSKRDPEGSKLLDDAMAADKSDEWFATRNKPKASG